MKRQIHAYKGHGDIAVEGHNIKLGRGGIREIEFFVQTQQLIAGGRNPALRGRETLAMLDALADGGWIDADARDRARRRLSLPAQVEHRLQMVADEQTHTLPTDRDGLDALRPLSRLRRPRRLRRRAGRASSRTVQRHYARLFEDAPTRAAEQRGLVFTAEPTTARRSTQLRAMGFRNPLEVSATVRALARRRAIAA